MRPVSVVVSWNWEKIDIVVSANRFMRKNSQSFITDSLFRIPNASIEWLKQIDKTIENQMKHISTTNCSVNSMIAFNRMTYRVFLLTKPNAIVLILQKANCISQCTFDHVTSLNWNTTEGLPFMQYM